MAKSTPRTSGSFDPARNWYVIVPGAAALTPRPKALYANVAGTLTCVGDDDNSVGFTVAAAGPVDLSPVKVTAWTGAAGTLIGLWD